MNGWRTRGLLAFSLLAASVASHAAVVFYTDRSAWEAGLAALPVLGARDVEDFDGLPNGTDLSQARLYPSDDVSLSLRFSPATQAPNENYVADGQAHLFMGYTVGRGYGDWSAASEHGRIGGFGFDVDPLEGAFAIYVDTLTEPYVDHYTEVDARTGFFGFIDTSGRTRQVVLAQRKVAYPENFYDSGVALFDNVTIQSVPEPASLAALALGGAALLRRHKA